MSAVKVYNVDVYTWTPMTPPRESKTLLEYNLSHSNVNI